MPLRMSNCIDKGLVYFPFFPPGTQIKDTAGPTLLNAVFDVLVLFANLNVSDQWLV